MTLPLRRRMKSKPRSDFSPLCCSFSISSSLHFSCMQQMDTTSDDSSGDGGSLLKRSYTAMSEDERKAAVEEALDLDEKGLLPRSSSILNLNGNGSKMEDDMDMMSGSESDGTGSLKRGKTADSMSLGGLASSSNNNSSSSSSSQV